MVPVIVRDAIHQSGKDPFSFFHWCARHLNLGNPDGVAHRLRSQFEGNQPLDIPAVQDVAFDVYMGRLQVT